MESVNHPIIALIGPTASGKSELALRLAKLFRGAVISADSQQIYKNAAIGTNQPSGKWQKMAGMGKLYVVNKVPHFFIDTLPPNKTYSASKFQTEANKLCHKLYTLDYLPILVGGTGLYVSALVEGYSFPKGKPNKKLRARLSKMSLQKLYQQLKKHDSYTASRIDKQNKRRLERALEYVLTNKTSFLKSQKMTPRPNTLIIGLTVPKTELCERINKRTANMLKRGLSKEVQNLKRHWPRSPLLSSIGYRETLPYMNGAITRQQLINDISTHTWQYSRRQMTWFKRIPNVHWIKNTRSAERLARHFLQNSN